MKKSIAVISLWRDNSEHISVTLDQLNEQEKYLHDEYSFIYSFYENDSIDNTPEILSEWLKGKQGFLKSEKRGDPKWRSIPLKKRTQYMAKYRNIALEAINNFQYDYLFVVDSDIIFNEKFLSKLIDQLDKNNNYGMITPNTTQSVPDAFNKHLDYSYFDSWALIDIEGNQSISFSQNPFLLASDRKSWTHKLPISVNSAFGGVALIRGGIIRENNIKWNGNDGCEHWKLCEEIRRLNFLIVVDPNIIAEAKHYKRIKSDLIRYKYDFYRLKKIHLGLSNLSIIKKIIINFNILFYLLLLKIKYFINYLLK